MLSPKYVYPEGIDKPQLDSSLTYDEFEDFCLDHAQRAQSSGVDIFCIGNELTLELSDDKSEELILHITHAGMMTVTERREVYAKLNDGKFNS